MPRRTAGGKAVDSEARHAIQRAFVSAVDDALEERLANLGKGSERESIGHLCSRPWLDPLIGALLMVKRQPERPHSLSQLRKVAAFGMKLPPNLPDLSEIEPLIESLHSDLQLRRVAAANRRADRC